MVHVGKIPCIIIYISTILIILPQIILGLIYINQHDCGSFVSPAIRFIINGPLTIFGLSIILMANITDKNTTLNSVFLMGIYVFGIALLIWQLVGAFIFWRNCSVQPIIVNILLWISLIFGYIVIVVLLCLFKIKE
jgi:hypothetical protein